MRMLPSAERTRQEAAERTRWEAVVHVDLVFGAGLGESEEGDEV